MSFLPVSASAQDRERFTRRLGAFSDLVFGFSLSLLAFRPDVPANVHDIFETTRVVPASHSCLRVASAVWRAPPSGISAEKNLGGEGFEPPTYWV